MCSSSATFDPDTLLLDALAMSTGSVAFGIGVGDLDISISSNTNRPTLTTTCSFSSTLSSTSDTSCLTFSTTVSSAPSSISETTPQASKSSRPASRRPTLSPQALYTHAFGCEAWQKKVQKDAEWQNENIDSDSSRRSSIVSPPVPLPKRISSPIAVSASPPPLGTFRSVKPGRPRSRLVDARQNSDNSISPSTAASESPTLDISAAAQGREDDGGNENTPSAAHARTSSSSPAPLTPRSSSIPVFISAPAYASHPQSSTEVWHEPPMSPSEWRKKSQERLTRRAKVLGLGPKGCKGKGRQSVPQRPFNIEEDVDAITFLSLAQNAGGVGSEWDSRRWSS